MKTLPELTPVKNGRCTHEPYMFLRDQQKQNTYSDATDSILSSRCSPEGAALFPYSLCFHYVLIPVDASQGLCMNAYYGYMGAKVCCVLRLAVNELSFGVSIQNALSVCGGCSPASRFFFYFNRCTVNSNNFLKNLFRKRG